MSRSIASTPHAWKQLRHSEHTPQERQRAASARARAQAVEEQAAPTVGGLVERYTEARERQLSPVTHREYLRTLRVDIRASQLGKMRAKDALRSQVRDFHARLGIIQGCEDLAGLDALAQMLAGAPGAPRAQLEETVRKALKWLADKPDHKALVAQLELVEINLPNLK